MFRALLVGINQYQSPDAPPLAGCDNDVSDVNDYLVSSNKLDQSEILALCDERATKDAIVSALNGIVSSSSTGDTLLFHFSGHGTLQSSADPNQANGQENVLCPYDFSWSDQDTALTATELDSILSSLPADVSLTMVFDSCHSGTRDVGRKTRFWPPPADVAIELARTARLMTPKYVTVPNGLVVAACAQGESASDTAFDDRPNGAFSYFWVAQLKKTPGASIADVLAGVAQQLVTYDMHPEADGSSALEASGLLAPSAEASRTMEPRALVASAPTQVLFDQMWSGAVLGRNVGVHLRISLDTSGLIFLLTGSLGVPVSLSCRVGGNCVVPVGLGYGFELVMTISKWAVLGTDVSFSLLIQAQPPIFGGPVTIVKLPLTLPRTPAPSPRGIPAATSFADFYALLKLLELESPDSGSELVVPPAITSRDVSGPPVPYTADGDWNSWPYGANLFGFSTNDLKFGNLVLPNGTVKDHIDVALDPPGCLNAYFVKWQYPDDPQNCSFVLHVGGSSCKSGTVIAHLFVRHVDSPPVV